LLLPAAANTGAKISKKATALWVRKYETRCSESIGLPNEKRNGNW
jgi:hypothetical protein